jgi:hypothetical protein
VDVPGIGDLRCVDALAQAGLPVLLKDGGEDCGARAKRCGCEVFGFESVGQELKKERDSCPSQVLAGSGAC